MRWRGFGRSENMAMMGSRGGANEGRSSSKLVRVLRLRNTMLFGYYVCTAEVGNLKYDTYVGA